eukprot:scaffold30308_cov28-Prasinocladus_malaysianus.AAC.2
MIDRKSNSPDKAALWEPSQAFQNAHLQSAVLKVAIKWLLGAMAAAFQRALNMRPDVSELMQTINVKSIEPELIQRVGYFCSALIPISFNVLNGQFAGQLSMIT